YQGSRLIGFGMTTCNKYECYFHKEKLSLYCMVELNLNTISCSIILNWVYTLLQLLLQTAFLHRLSTSLPSWSTWDVRILFRQTKTRIRYAPTPGRKKLWCLPASKSSFLKLRPAGQEPILPDKARGLYYRRYIHRPWNKLNL